MVKRVVNGLSSSILVSRGKASGGDCEGSERNQHDYDKDLIGSFVWKPSVDFTMLRGVIKDGRNFDQLVVQEASSGSEEEFHAMS